MGAIDHWWTYDTGQIPAGGLGPNIADLYNNGKWKIIVAGENYPQPDWLYVLNSNGTLFWKKQLIFSTRPHNPVEAYDLNNDRLLEIIVPSPWGMEVYKPNGALYWSNPAILCSEAHIVVMDTDQNNLPYIYASNASTGGIAKLKKIDGRTGEILIQVDDWYPCHGGLSAEFIDGTPQLFMSDRNTGEGRGIQSYDARTLELLWERPEIGCSSHLPVLIDVTGNGIPDVVISRQEHDGPGAGVYCLDAKTGADIPGKIAYSIPGLEVHEAFPVHDIKGDGDLRLSSCVYSDVKVVNLTTMSIEAILTYDGKGPSYGKVWDDKFNIILADETGSDPIRIYSNNYQLLYEIPESQQPSAYGATVQDIDNDGFNELVTIAYNGQINVWRTTGIADHPLPRTNTNHYSERNTRTGVYIPPPGDEEIKDWTPLILGGLAGVAGLSILALIIKYKK